MSDCIVLVFQLSLHTIPDLSPAYLAACQAVVLWLIWLTKFSPQVISLVSLFSFSQLFLSSFLNCSFSISFPESVFLLSSTSTSKTIKESYQCRSFKVIIDYGDLIIKFVYTNSTNVQLPLLLYRTSVQKFKLYFFNK